MSAGSAAMLLAARTLAGEAGGNIVAPLLASFYLGVTADVQDFRDEEGDRAAGRKTTAVLLGVKNARKVWAVQFLVASAALVKRVCQGLSFWPDSLIGISGLLVSFSALGGKSAQHDDKSYKYFLLYIYSVFFRSAFWAQAM